MAKKDVFANLFHGRKWKSGKESDDMINSMMADTLFGSSKMIGSGSFLSASNFGDLALIRSGVYTRMMRSYISQLTDGDDSTSKARTVKTDDFRNMVSDKFEKLRNPEKPTAQTEANKVLSGIKSSSKSLETAAKDLSGMDFDTSTREELYDAAKKYVSGYNSVLTEAKKTDNVSLTQSVKWMKDDTKAREKILAKVGITIGTDGALTLDEEKFKSANQSDIETLMKGSGSLAGRAAQRATGLYNLAANQISFNSGSTLYSSSGVLK